MESVDGMVSKVYLEEVGRFIELVKHRTYSLMQIQAGHQVLDVGCGTGIDTINLAKWVGPTGWVYGIDADDTMIAEAEQRVKLARLGERVSHKRADSKALPFETNFFDSCRSERLFQHLSHPELALEEMVRVTRPGGWVVVLDTDWGTLSVDTPEIDVERRLIRFLADRYLANGFSGRRLYRLCKHLPLDNISYEMFPLTNTHYGFARMAAQLEEVERMAVATGVINTEELERWRASLEIADSMGTFFASVSMVLVAGQKRSNEDDIALYS